MPIRLTADARKLVFLLALLSLQCPDPAAELLDALGSTRSWCVSARPARPKAGPGETPRRLLRHRPGDVGAGLAPEFSPGKRSVSCRSSGMTCIATR